MQKIFIIRHKTAKGRDYYDDNGFLEDETPMLTKSTPEGAKGWSCSKQKLSWNILCTASIATNF